MPMDETADWIEEPGKARYTSKDSVFTDLFHIPSYAVEMVQALRPDLTLQETDIEFVTLRSVLMVRPYNDMGVLVKGNLLICSEAQSIWSLNVLVRIFLYLAETYHRYIKSHKEFNLYGTKKIPLPIPACYVIYTGNDKGRPEYLSLAHEFFGKDSPLDLQVKVLSTAGTEDIIQQYIRFCHVFDEQVQKYGRTKQAVEQTIHICQDENVLRKYLEERKKEVKDIMMTLFQQEEVTERYGYECREQGREEGANFATLQNLRAIIQKLHISPEEAMDTLQIPPEKQKELSPLL